MSAIEVIGQQSRAVQISLGSILLLLVGTGALFASSSFLEFSVFFIIPVAYFTWFIHRKAGAMANAVSAAVTLWANIASPLHVSHPGVAYWNALIWFSFFVSITFIVAALKVLHDRERQLSRVDSLTGIGNRLAFYEFATAERNRALRSHQPITLAYLGLDGFKDINDTLGHQTGDKVLVNVARTMHTSVRQTDMVARMGGDEFALILPDTNKAAAHWCLSQKIRSRLLCIHAAAKLRIASSSTIFQRLPFVVIHFFFLKSPKILDVVSRVLPIDWLISSWVRVTRIRTPPASRFASGHPAQ